MHRHRLSEFIKQFPKAYVDAKKGGIFKLSYLNEWQALINAIVNNSDVKPTLIDGKKAVELILAAIASTKTRKAVAL